MLFNYETREVKVGNAHGAPRVWIDGRPLVRAGFDAGAAYAVEINGTRVTLRVSPTGERIVSTKKRGDEALPVIDLNSAKTIGAFDGLDRVRVIIRPNEIILLPLATRANATERLSRLAGKIAAGEPLRVGSLCHGGGTTSFAMHTGFSEAGVKTELGFANDIDAEVLAQAAEHNPVWNPSTAAIAAPMQEVAADRWLLSQLGRVEILEAGIPCVAASLAGRSKKGLKMAEEDPNAGHLVAAFLALVNALQPAVIVVENVPPYQTTASAHVIRNTLRDWGYNIAEAVLDAQDFGSIEARKRLAMVATTAGLSFDFEDVVRDPSGSHTLAEILEAIPDDASCWSEMGYLRDKEERDLAAGKGFRMQIVGPESTKIGTIGADYQKNRSTEPKVRHPVLGDALLRLLTPTEHARIKGVPDALIAGMPPTRAHHLLGNGVNVQTFRAVAVALGRALIRAFAPVADAIPIAEAA